LACFGSKTLCGWLFSVDCAGTHETRWHLG
jgi:hypothetical protein